MAGTLQMVGELCSPPTRGWTGAHPHFADGVRVFPAHAGMDRNSRSRRHGTECVPRPRGDGPATGRVLRSCCGCSPPTRGWTGYPSDRNPRVPVFPAHAGMDRPARLVGSGARGVPRPRGDGPLLVDPGAVRQRVPRPRGDGPAISGQHVNAFLRSPPTRGWTAPSLHRNQRREVFPAHAGMDRRRTGVSGARSRVPRPRGDGPFDRGMPAHEFRCSPPTRGWTVPGSHRRQWSSVFPAHAGMDRS